MNRSIIIKDINGNKCYPYTLRGNVSGLNSELQRIWEAIGIADPTNIITLFTGEEGPSNDPEIYEDLKPGDFYYCTGDFSFWYCWVVVTESQYSYCGWMSLSGKESKLELPLSDLFTLPTEGVGGTSYTLQSINNVKLPAGIDITASVPLMSDFWITPAVNDQHIWECDNTVASSGVKTVTKPGLNGTGLYHLNCRLYLLMNARSITAAIIRNRFNDFKVSFTVTPSDLEEIAEDVETLKNQVSDILANKQDNLSFTNGVQKSNSNVVSVKVASETYFSDNLIDPNVGQNGIYASPSRLPYHILSSYPNNNTGNPKNTLFALKEPILSLPYEHIYDKENKFSSLGTEGTGWEVYTSDDAKVSCKSTILKGSDDYLSITPLERNFETGDTWSIQLKKKVGSLLQVNKTYVVKMLVQGSDSTNCKLSCTGQDGVITTLNGNKQVISATFQGGYGDFYIGLGWTGINKTITIYSLLVYEQVTVGDQRLIYASDTRNAYDQYVQLGESKNRIPEKISQDNNAIRALDAEIREIRSDEPWETIKSTTDPDDLNRTYEFEDVYNKYRKIRVIFNAILSEEVHLSSVTFAAYMKNWTPSSILTVEPPSGSFKSNNIQAYCIFDFENLFIKNTLKYAYQFNGFEEKTFLGMDDKLIGVLLYSVSPATFVSGSSITIQGIRW